MNGGDRGGDLTMLEKYNTAIYDITNNVSWTSITTFNNNTPPSL